MRLARIMFVGAIVLSIVGLMIAVALGEREFGVALFLVGFFLAAGLVVVKIFLTGNHELGRLGAAIKIAVGGFGVILFGQLLGLILGEGNKVGDFTFYVGILVMLIGIVVGVLGMTSKS